MDEGFPHQHRATGEDPDDGGIDHTRPSLKCQPSERKTDMRRRISMLLAAALAVTGFVVLGPSQPASAFTVCGGTGFADITGGGILYPVTINRPGKDGLEADILIGDLTTNPSYGFRFYFETPVLTVPGGTCAHLDAGLTTNKTPTSGNPVTGTVLGYCGLSSGKGTFPVNNDLFAFIGVGGILVITGHVVGLVNAVPDTLSGESCTHTGEPGTLPGAGALRFRIQGAVVLLNCNATLPTTLDTETLTPQVLLDVLTVGVPIHLKIHLSPHIFTNSPCVPDPTL